MKNLDDLLDAVRTITGSDYRTAAILGVERMAVSGWRSRKSMPNNKHLLMMVDLAKLNLREAIEAVEYSREFERPMKQAGFADFGMLSIVAGMSLGGVSPTWGAATGAGLIGISYALYIMRSDGTIEIRLCGKVKTQLDSSPLQQYEHLIPANDAIAA